MSTYIVCLASEEDDADKLLCKGLSVRISRKSRLHYLCTAGCFAGNLIPNPQPRLILGVGFSSTGIREADYTYIRVGTCFNLRFTFLPSQLHGYHDNKLDKPVLVVERPAARQLNLHTKIGVGARKVRWKAH